MADSQQSATEVRDTDIVFDCPFCGKSLCIDYRGAGLTIPCTDCGKLVEVPIPDGMELEDLDRNAEEQEVNILHLRRQLSAAEARLVSLQQEVERLSSHGAALEEFRTGGLYRVSQIAEKMQVMEQALKTAVEAQADVVRLAREVLQAPQG